MRGTTEAFSRVKIDALLRGFRLDLRDGVSVRFEYSLPADTCADYVLRYQSGYPMAPLAPSMPASTPSGLETMAATKPSNLMSKARPTLRSPAPRW